MAINTKKVKNVATSQTITAGEATAIANRQIWQREFKADYSQVVLRVAVLNGLRFGAPPTTAG